MVETVAVVEAHPVAVGLQEAGNRIYNEEPYNTYGSFLVIT